ncbi:MAG: hypothetical protein CME15_06620 [Gemmatimonadetes bacterium]|nr:hypothetical protein [Gemmatimonadota bacterium]
MRMFLFLFEAMQADGCRGWIAAQTQQTRLAPGCPMTLLTGTRTATNSFIVDYEDTWIRRLRRG